MKLNKSIMCLGLVAALVGCLPTSDDDEDPKSSSVAKSSETVTSSSSEKKPSSSSETKKSSESKDASSSSQQKESSNSDKSKEDLSSSSAVVVDSTVVSSSSEVFVSSEEQPEDSLLISSSSVSENPASLEGGWIKEENDERSIMLFEDDMFALSTWANSDDFGGWTEMVRIYGNYVLANDTLVLSYNECFLIDASSSLLSGNLYYQEVLCSEITEGENDLLSVIQVSEEQLVVDVGSESPDILLPYSGALDPLELTPEVSSSSEEILGDVYTFIDSLEATSTAMNFVDDSTLTVTLSFGTAESDLGTPFLKFVGPYSFSEDTLTVEYVECYSLLEGEFMVDCADVFDTPGPHIVLQGYQWVGEDLLLIDEEEGTQDLYIKQ